METKIVDMCGGKVFLVSDELPCRICKRVVPVALYIEGYFLCRVCLGHTVEALTTFEEEMEE